MRFLLSVAVVFFHKFNNFNWLFSDQYSLIYRGVNFFSRHGFKGVNFFFVLSGFLINYLICKEIGKTSTFNYKNFVIRRILRIWPLYFLVLAIGFLLNSDSHGIGFYLSFTSNVPAIYNTKEQSGILFPLWSVGVEEQFYIIIPFLIYYFRLYSFKKLSYFYFCLLFISISYQLFFYKSIERLHYSTISCFTDISVGALAGISAYHSKKVKHFFENMSKKIILLIYISGLILMVLTDNLELSIWGAFNRLFLSLFFAFILLEQTFTINSFFKISNFKFITNSGNYTYSLYLTHMIILTYMHYYWIHFKLYDSVLIDIFVKFGLGLGLSYILSILLFKFIEKPFLDLKTKFN